MQELNITALEDKKKFGIIQISTQRRFIMGIAILWVAWFHTDLIVGIPGLSFLREVGYGGVDLSFLLSFYCYLAYYDESNRGTVWNRDSRQFNDDGLVVRREESV